VYYGRRSYSLTRGDYGQFRRGVEGVRARTKALGSGYPGNWGVSWTQSHWSYPEESEEAETNGFGRGTQEDGYGAESAVGEGKTSGSVHTSAYHEPSCTAKNFGREAGMVGQEEVRAKEGSLARFRSFSSNRKESGGLPRSLFL